VTQTAPDGRHAWRRSARVAAILSGLVGIVIMLVAAGIVWSWRDDLPDPIASHWSGGMEPNGFSSLAQYVGVLLGTGIGCCLLFVIIGWIAGRTASTRRITAGAAIWVGGLIAILLIGSVGMQRGLADARQAKAPSWLLPLAVIAPLVPAIIAALLVPGDRPQPVTTPVPTDAPRLQLGAGEQRIWTHRTGGGPGLVVVGFVMVVTVLLAVGLQQWGLLVVSGLLILIFLVMFGWVVRVDRDGMTVRSMLGWPRTRIRLDEIEMASVIEVDPFRQFGGWGWRVGRGGRIGVVLRHGDGLLVEQSGGRSFVITVDDAATGAALLNTMAERNRSG
jgi:MFS family permease